MDPDDRALCPPQGGGNRHQTTRESRDPAYPECRGFPNGGTSPETRVSPREGSGRIVTWNVQRPDWETCRRSSGTQESDGGSLGSPTPGRQRHEHLGDHSRPNNSSHAPGTATPIDNLPVRKSRIPPLDSAEIGSPPGLRLRFCETGTSNHLHVRPRDLVHCQCVALCLMATLSSANNSQRRLNVSDLSKKVSPRIP